MLYMFGEESGNASFIVFGLTPLTWDETMMYLK